MSGAAGPHILVLPGSARLGSPNRRLAAEAARRLALTHATVTLIDLEAYALPPYDADGAEPENFPPNALLLAERLAEQDGLLLVAPEVNGAAAPLLMNALAWTSQVRKVRGRPLQPFARLVVGLASASRSPLGGLRGLAALRGTCQALGAEVLTPQVTLADAAKGLDDRDRITDEAASMALDILVERLLEFSRTLGRHRF
ncbi:NADPH-dependent FMN reductase [Aureimonas glaciei]|uniref:Oxidoreductase n=1 Tax=Aureimonas glaciei TaxID=1776957 RepID=A0A916V1L2_9HYPH|nr:NAD(P)H-dependent oxidoreductase [Aureimonas glaciei]GGD02713.1 oxidoreductase [Aureimonas glaciei]